MRHIASLAIALLFTVPATFGAGPLIKFIETAHDFGNIKETSGPVSHEFRFANTGDTPLVILSATTSCGCTSPAFPKEPVEPGDTAILRVTYNPAGRPGEFNKSITVKTNSSKGAKARLRISGVVIPR